MTEDPKRRSRTLEYLKKQAEERAKAEAESGDETPFPDLRAELGLGGSSDSGDK